MNPLILRGIRENLRIKHLVAAGLFSLIVSSTVYMTAFLNGSEGKYTYDKETQEWGRGEPSDINGARNAFPYLLALQGFYLMFLGTGRVASITAEERESGLLDYQRMTPMNPLSKIVGYIFGIPAREYYMFLFTLPFLLHCVIMGQLPWSNILHLYAVFFSCVILYHLTAHSVGLVVPKPRAASWVSRIAVLGLYVALPGFGQAGISFLSFLTILPTYFGKILPILKFENQNKLGRFESKAVEFWQDIPFFNLEISPSAFTFFMQALLILTFLITAYRKWRNQSLPAFSKPSGLLLFSIFQFLLLGSLWPFFSKGQASGLLGESLSANAFGFHDAAVVFILVQSIFLGLSIFAILTLCNICCPNQHLFIKGLQRAEKLALPRVPHGADERSGIWFVCLLSIITGGIYMIFLYLAHDSGIWKIPSIGLSSTLLPLLGLLATALYLQASRELWFNLGFWGFVGLLWITPLLASMVLAVGWEEEYLDIILKLLALNPMSIISLHLITEYSEWLRVPTDYLHHFNEAYWFGLATCLLLALSLQIRLQLKRKQK